MRRTALTLIAALLSSSAARAQQPGPQPELAPSARPRIVIFDAHASGVDSRAAISVTASLRRAAEGLGYSALPSEQARAALARAAGFGALSPERALAATRATGSAYGVFAKVSAETGRYVVSVTLIAADGSAPRHARESAAHGELEAATERALRSVLQAPALPPVARPAPALPPPAPQFEREPELYEQRFRLAVQTEAAFGVITGPFYNHLAGARLDRRFSEEMSLGAYVGYANLKGKEGRAHNLLSYFLFEYRATLASDWALPFRFAPGYLPKNGPTLRLSAGLAFEPANDVEIVIEPLVPMLWMTGDKAVISLNVAAELSFTL